MPSLVEISPVNLEKNCLIINVILLFRNYLPLEKGWALYLNKFEYTLPKDALFQVYNNDFADNDNGQIDIKKSSVEPSVQVS